MVRRSSLIFAASLAVLSTLEPTFGFAAVAPAQHNNEVEKPRFLRREIKRQFLNTTTSGGPQGFRGPFGGESSTDLESLTQSLTSTTERGPVAVPETTTTPPTQTPPSEAEILRQVLSSQSQLSQSVQEASLLQQQSQTPPTTATPSFTSTPANTQETIPTTSAAPATSATVTSDTNEPATQATATAIPTTTPSVDSNTNGPATQPTTSPAFSISLSNTNGPEIQSTTTAVAVTSPSVNSNTNGPEIQSTTTAVAVSSVTLNTNGPEIQSTTTAVAVSSVSSNTNGPEIQSTTTAVAVTSPSVNSNTNGQEIQSTTTAVAVTSPSVNSNTNGPEMQLTTSAAPATSPSVNSNTNEPAIQPTTDLVPASSLSNTNGLETNSATTATPATSPVDSITNGANTQLTTAAINSESSLLKVISGTKSSDTAVVGLSTSQLPASQTPVSQSTKPTDSGIPAISSSSEPSVPSVAGSTTTGGQTTSGILPANSLSSLGYGGSSELLPGFQQSATIVPSVIESSVGQQTPETTGSVPSATSSNDVQQTAPSLAAETNADSETKPTTGVTARTPTYTPEGQTTPARQPTSTQPSTGQQIPSSLTAPNLVQNTKSSATELGQSSAPSGTKQTNSQSIPVVPSLPSGSQQSATNALGQQTSPKSNTPGAPLPTGSQQQSGLPSIPSVADTNQQPFTQPGQTQTSQGSAGATHTTPLPGGTEQNPTANAVIPSTSGSVLPTLGETAKSSPFSSIPNAQTSASNAANPSVGTEAPTNTQISQAGLIPTLGTSGIPSVGTSFGGSNTNGAQPASSPSLPESAVVLPTTTERKPQASTGSGEALLPTTAVQQGTSVTSVVVQDSQSSAANLNTGNFEDSIPTGSQLYSVLRSALSATVGSGSTMLPNGAVVPTAQSVEGGNTVASQSVQQSGAQGQESGMSAITPAPSITLSPSSVVPNPLASSQFAQQTQAASVTLSNGNVVPNSLSSNLPTSQTGTQQQSETPFITLPGGSSIPNPSASTPLGSISPEDSGVSSNTLSDGGVIPNPSASIAPVTSDGIVTNLPGSDSTVLPVVPASVTLSDGSVAPNPLATISPPGFSVSSPGSDITAVPVIPASVTFSDGSVVSNPLSTVLPSVVSFSNGQNPTETPLASGTASNPVISETGSGFIPTNSAASEISTQNPLGATVSNSAQGSGALPQASTTDSNGVALPFPVQSTAPINTATVNTGLTESNSPITTGALASGSLSSNLPANTGTDATGAGTPSGGVVSETVAIAASGTIPSSSTLPVVVGSTTNSNGETIPITASQVIGSSTLSDGAVVPLTPSIPSASLASNAPVPSSAASGSQTLSDGVIVPSASGSDSPTATNINQGSGNTGQTEATQTAASQNTAGPTGGATVSPQSESLRAPSTVTGTATGPPSPAATTPQKSKSDDNGPFTQQPTGWDTRTAQSVATSILAQPSSTFASQTSYSGPTGLPTGVPLVLYPAGGQVNKPDNTELIQIGFLYPLNYDFVLTNPESQAQIFKYLPMGIAWGLQIDIENVTMRSLRALDTTQDLHYITTLALAWVPSGQVDNLGLLVHTSTSRLYHTPDNSTNTLLSMINIALPIAADNSTDGGDSTSFGAMPSSTSTMNDGGAPVGGSIGNSNPVRASSVGIAAGVACGAAAYGAAMFFVARRYRKRRQSHLRSPSMFNSPVMSHLGPDAGAGAALMSGGVGDHRSPSPYHDEDARAASRGSGRSASTGRQQISAPVMAENSLGWN